MWKIDVSMRKLVLALLGLVASARPAEALSCRALGHARGLQDALATRPATQRRVTLLCSATQTAAATDGTALQKPLVYFVMGGPGSGKGTQCALLAQRYQMTHLSAGELLRAEVRSGSPDGQAIAKLIAEGEIVRSETTVALLRKAMGSGAGPFLIDGFPRSLENLEAFDEAMGSCNFMLFLEVSEDEMLSRLLKRSETSGRSDDNEETIRKRFRTFQQESMPVISTMSQRGLLRRVSAEGTTDEVFERVSNEFEPEADQ